MKNKIVKSLMVLVSVVILNSCNDEAKIQQSYDYSLSSWYLKKDVLLGEEVEIRFYLNRQGNWRDAEYRIGYVQLEGEGRVYDLDRKILTNRETIPLAGIPKLDNSDPYNMVFTLYYRCLSANKSEIRFFVIDNFGLERELIVTFNPEEEKE